MGALSSPPPLSYIRRASDLRLGAEELWWLWAFSLPAPFFAFQRATNPRGRKSTGRGGAFASPGSGITSSTSDVVFLPSWLKFSPDQTAGGAEEVTASKSWQNCSKIPSRGAFLATNPLLNLGLSSSGGEGSSSGVRMCHDLIGNWCAFCPLFPHFWVQSCFWAASWPRLSLLSSGAASVRAVSPAAGGIFPSQGIFLSTLSFFSLSLASQLLTLQDPRAKFPPEQARSLLPRSLWLLPHNLCRFPNLSPSFCSRPLPSHAEAHAEGGV